MFDTLEEAEKLASFLQDKGIAIDLEEYVPGFRDGNIGKSKVWAALDFQYDDALALMDNPDHVVNNPVNPEEYSDYMSNEDATEDGLNIFVQSALKVAGVMLVIAMIVLFALSAYFKRHS